MPRKPPKPRITLLPPQPANDPQHASICERFSGWTGQQIHNLITHQDVPEHWWQSQVPNLAFVETTRIACNNSTTSYRDVFPKILDALHLKRPLYLSNFLRKTMKNAVKATQGNNAEVLLSEVSELVLAKSTRQIGPLCQSAGITISWLQNSKENAEIAITNEMALEIAKYKTSSAMTWQDLSVLWPRLFPRTNVPGSTRIRQRFKELPKKREMLRKKGQVQLTGWLGKPFCAEINEHQHDNVKLTEDEFTQEESESDDSDCDWSPEINAQEVLEYEKHQQERESILERALETSIKSMKNLQEQMEKNEKFKEKLEKQKDKFKYMYNKINKEHTQLKQQMRVLVKRNRQLEKELGHMKRKNMKKRIKTGENAIDNLKEKVNSLQDSHDEHVENLLSSVIEFYTATTQVTYEASTSSISEQSTIELEMKHENLKRKLLEKANGSPSKTLKQPPFPANDIVGKRISHKWSKTPGKRGHFYKGTVLRKSTHQDKEEGMDLDDEYLLGTMEFYTIMYDIEEQLYSIPLEKDWNEKLVKII